MSSNISSLKSEGLYSVAIWHMERRSFHQARKFLSYLISTSPKDSLIWISLSICCAYCNDIDDANTYLQQACSLISNSESDPRIFFVKGLINEMKNEYEKALNNYIQALKYANHAYNTTFTPPSTTVASSPPQEHMESEKEIEMTSQENHNENDHIDDNYSDNNLIIESSTTSNQTPEIIPVSKLLTTTTSTNSSGSTSSAYDMISNIHVDHISDVIKPIESNTNHIIDIDHSQICLTTENISPTEIIPNITESNSNPSQPQESMPLDDSNTFKLTSTTHIPNFIIISKICILSGDILLRIGYVYKEMNLYEDGMSITQDMIQYCIHSTIQANALCLKGLLHEVRHEYPAAEVIYRSALQLLPGHTATLERLGRIYLRYRDTIPAAVQCFVKYVEVDPSGYIAWYLLGRCYMATAQYNDAWEAYNRAIHINPNDSQIWCSLGVLYYSFGQYKESLGMFSKAIKLNPLMAEAWYNVGALYDICDQSEDSQKAYIKAKEAGLSNLFPKQNIYNMHIHEALGNLPIQPHVQIITDNNMNEDIYPVGNTENIQDISNVNMNN